MECSILKKNSFVTETKYLLAMNDTVKPGSKALENMKLLEKESRIFKKPKVPQKRVSKNSVVTILDEDKYIEGISKIIQRDFFPDLEKLNAQNSFLEATEQNDHLKLRELYSRYSGGHKPPTDVRASPATFETPGVDRPFTPTPNESPLKTTPEVQKQAEVDKDNNVNIQGHTLDSYLAGHTSEDNDSFNRLTAAEELKRTRKAFGPSVTAIESIAAYKLNESLALPSIEQQADQTERPLELDMWGYRAKNYIMYVPDGHISPGDIKPKPELQYHNTRLKQQPFDPEKDRHTITEMAKSQMRTKDGRIEPDGTRLGPVAEQQERGFVCTPSPRPGHDGDESPLMTWGEIDGTPFRLDAGDTPLPSGGGGSGYHMLEMGSRERLALRLAERRRPTPIITRTPAVTPYPRTPGGLQDRLMQMSPAARRLATSASIGTPLAGLVKANTPRTAISKLLTPGVGARKAVTPKTAKRKPSTPLSKLVKPSVHAPADASTASVGIAKKNNLTDDLLQINVPKRKRLTAADFFS